MWWISRWHSKKNTYRLRHHFKSVPFKPGNPLWCHLGLDSAARSEVAFRFLHPFIYKTLWSSVNAPAGCKHRAIYFLDALLKQWFSTAGFSGATFCFHDKVVCMALTSWHNNKNTCLLCIVPFKKITGIIKFKYGCCKTKFHILIYNLDFIQIYC